MRHARVLPFLAVLAALPLRADGGDFGLQIGAAAPLNSDLKATAGSVGGSGGLHVTFHLPGTEASFLRIRADVARFSRQTQEVAAPLGQTLETQVTEASGGLEYLVRFQGPWSPFGLGLGAYEARWTVESTNRLDLSGGGTTTFTGKAHWGRLAFGPVLTCTASRHLEFEARLVLSRYGQQNASANTFLFGLLLNF